jgi:DNA-binding response OmpR family regulator
LDNLQRTVGTSVAVPGRQVRHKILIVDDNEAARTGLAQIFERADFDVVAVGTFAEGRAALLRDQPDMLIADVRLGEYNGLQLLASTTKATQSIVVTGYPDPVLEADARRMGAEYLVKPVLPTALIELVRRKLSPGGDPVFRPARKYERKQVIGTLPARIAGETARILDVSYGGLRLEMARRPEKPVPSSFQLELPSSGVSVQVDVVWTHRMDQHWVCGASVVPGTAAGAWHGVVDAVA